MADYIDANTKGTTGKQPRVQRTRTNSSNTSTQNQPIVPQKRKSKTNEVTPSKYLRLEDSKSKVKSKVGSTSSSSTTSVATTITTRRVEKNLTKNNTTNSSAKRVETKTNNSKNNSSTSTTATTRFLRKRKVEGGNQKSVKVEAEEDSDNSSAATTDQEESLSSSNSKQKYTASTDKDKDHKQSSSTSRKDKLPISTNKTTKGVNQNKGKKNQPSTSSVEVDQAKELNTSVSGRSLRLTPGRAAAAAQAEKQKSETEVSKKSTTVAVNQTKSSRFIKIGGKKKPFENQQQKSAGESNLPGPSSTTTSTTTTRVPYELRSRGNSESGTSSTTTTTTKTKGKEEKKSSTYLKVAQILSNKEKGYLRKKKDNHKEDTSSSSGNSKVARKPSSTTTGSCASHRSGGGPSSEVSGGPESSKSEATGGMNQSSGGTGGQSTSNGADPLASNLARGLAMLDSEDSEGEMNRLQVLLEARGFDLHRFGSLAPRMQQLLHSSIHNSSVTKAQGLLQGLQAVGDEGQQLQAAIEMCQLLVMGNEDTLAGFPVKQTVPALITLLSMENNFDMMNHACRALTYMMEALPRSIPIVSEAVPVFLEKLQVIQCMDVAEQSLTALEMLSRRHAKTILQAKGVSASLTYLDFFSISAQRSALQMTANCCQSVHSEEFHFISESLPFLASRLTQQDKKSVESVCLAFSRLVESVHDTSKLQEIASPELLSNLQQLLVVTPPLVSTSTFILVLRMLSQLCARNSAIAVKLLEQNIVGTLSSLLFGSKVKTDAANKDTTAVDDDVELVSRNPQELLEIVTLIAELLPKLPKDGPLFAVNNICHPQMVSNTDAIQWQWKDDRGMWNSYSPFDSRVIESAHQGGDDEITLSMSMSGRTYTVDFLTMTQISDSSTARSIQRKINSGFNAKNSSSGGAGDSKDNKGGVQDQRLVYLNSHTDFPLSFLKPLFALLSEANSSSTGPGVRQSCVKTLLRIIHFIPAESLKKSLKTQQASNMSITLASMLGSSDLKIVVGSFQICSLLMDKLSDIFVLHFRREGVFHQISTLSQSDIVNPSPLKSEIASLLGIPTTNAVVSSPTIISAHHSGGVNAIHFSTSAPASGSPAAVPPEYQHPVIQKLPISLPISSSPYGFGFGLPPITTTSTTNNNTLPQPPPAHLGIDSSSIVTPMSENQNVPSGGGSGQASGTTNVHPIISANNLATAIFGSKTSASSKLDKSSTSINIKQELREDSFPLSYASVASSLISTNDAASGQQLTTIKNNSSEKKVQDEYSQAISDAFKRKRISKRPIPTSTTRRQRQEDPSSTSSSKIVVHDYLSGKSPQNLSSSPDSNTPNSQGSSSSSSSSKKAGSERRSFFSNLNPSKWRSSNSSSPGGNASPPVHQSSFERAASGVLGGSTSTGNVSGQPPNPRSNHNANAFLAISYKENIKTWLKEQSTLFTNKYYTKGTTKESSSSPTTNNNGIVSIDEVGILPKLNEIIINLQKRDKSTEALKELKTIVVESDISSFEVNHSGLIGALLGYLIDEKSNYLSTREDRIRSFIHVFADCPLDELSGEELNTCLANISGSRKSALSALVLKLNNCLNQLEQFPVKVHEIPTSGSSRGSSSALRFFNTHQLKCVLQRHPSCNNLRKWKGGPVKIDPLALVQAIERYLIVRGFGSIRENTGRDSDSDDNSDEELELETLAMVNQSRHKIQFLIGDHVLPYNMTVYQGIRQFGMNSAGGSSSSGGIGDHSGDLETEYDPSSAIFGASDIFRQCHTIFYRPLPSDSDVNSNTPSSSSKSSSKKSKGFNSKKDNKKDKKDPIWNGDMPNPIPPFLPYLAKLNDKLTISDPSLPVLTLLRVINAICRYWRYLYWPILPGGPLLPMNEFINTKVSAKAQRQLQDPVSTVTGNIPIWLQQIGSVCPFIFPFGVRQMLFYSISFDRDRALQRLLDSVPELNNTEREEQIRPRIDRRKRTISRDNILSQAEQIMNDFGSTRPLIEIQYENEVGTGLGPTLEFYALVSQELQKKELELWHSQSSVDNEHTIGNDDGISLKSKNYINTNACGLFPRPIGKAGKSGQVAKIKSKFKFLGRFMAKAVMDSRMIDLPLSLTQYKWFLGCENSLTLADMNEIDSTVARSIRKLVSVVVQKKKLERNKSLGLSGDLTRALEELTLDGCRIDNLGLDFTLPGYPGIELRKNGKDIPVTIHNLEEYVKLVTYWMLNGGVSRQIESWREGFDSVFPSSSLKMFYPEELEMVFCGANQSVGDKWDVKTLVECCRPDHGFNHESRAIQNLFDIMSNFDAQERRKFIQFVTGSPRLPVGGLRSLQPPLTIVKKTIDDPNEADKYLPSVMTCVNYLKLPDYSSLEIMRERLKVAADEGQLSFHLS